MSEYSDQALALLAGTGETVGNLLSQGYEWSGDQWKNASGAIFGAGDE